MEVVVRPASLDASAGGSIAGPIWLRHGRRDERPADFPETNWVDFPVVILGWWIAELERNGVTATCRFMDGPLEFTAMRDAPTLVRVRCSRRSAGATFLARRDELRAAILAAAASVLAACERSGWSGDDIDRLRAALEGARPPR